MKDPNERYWLFVVFTAWKTRQHLSATAFLPFSNIDFLHLLLSVCLCWYKPNKFKETNFCRFFFFFFWRICTRLLSSARLSQSKRWRICRLRVFLLSPWGIQWSLHAWSLACYLLVLLDWDEFGGAFTPANRDVCTWPRGLGLMGWTVLLLPPQANNTKKSTSARLISLPCPSALLKGV